MASQRSRYLRHDGISATLNDYFLTTRDRHVAVNIDQGTDIFGQSHGHGRKRVPVQSNVGLMR